MSISSVPFVKGMKADQVMPSLRRNYRACSVLMVNKAATDALEKHYFDKLHEYTKLSCVMGCSAGDNKPSETGKNRGWSSYYVQRMDEIAERRGGGFSPGAIHYLASVVAEVSTLIVDRAIDEAKSMGDDEIDWTDVRRIQDRDPQLKKLVEGIGNNNPTPSERGKRGPWITAETTDALIEERGGRATSAASLYMASLVEEVLALIVDKAIDKDRVDKQEIDWSYVRRIIENDPELQELMDWR